MVEHDSILASPIFTKYVSFLRVPTGNVYNHKTKLYYFYDWHQFGVLQSSLHQEWACWRCATLGGTTFAYSTTAALETWPMPHANATALGKISRVAEAYHNCRQAIMANRQEGLTAVYNRFHDPEETSADIQKLRQLHVEMDQAVAAAYGWTDLNLGHGFHQTKQGLRFTISEAARREIFGRLLKLNHERYAEEVARGLHEKKKPKTTRARPKKAPSASGPSLFGGEE
jgi:hypothetical protein